MQRPGGADLRRHRDQEPPGGLAEDEHAVVRQNLQRRRLAGVRGEPFELRLDEGAQVVAQHRAGAQGDHTGTDAEPAAGRIAHHQPFALECRQQPVRGRAAEVHRLAQISDGDLAVLTRQLLQQSDRPNDRLRAFRSCLVHRHHPRIASISAIGRIGQD